MFMFRVCHVVLSVHCSHMVIYLKRADLLALLYVMFSCVFVIFQCGVLGQVLGVSILAIGSKEVVDESFLGKPATSPGSHILDRSNSFNYLGTCPILF